MLDRRIEARMLCADLIQLRWKDKSGRLRQDVANLEDISLSGACVQADMPVPLNTHLEIVHQKAELGGVVRYCVFRDTGYFIGVQFDPGIRWSQKRFRPKHMLDPRRLVALRLKKEPSRDQ